MLLFSDWVKKLNEELTALKSEKDNFENKIGDILKQVGEEKAKINVAIDNLNTSFADICSFEFEDGKIIVIGDDAVIDAYRYDETEKSFVQDESITFCNFVSKHKRIAYCKKIDVIYSELEKI